MKLPACLVLGILWLPSAVLAVEFEYFGVFDIYGVATDASNSWLNGGLGKTRYSEDRLDLGQAMLGGNVNITDTLVLHGVGSLYTDPDAGPDTLVDITELFLHYRPVPTSAVRHELKIGAFFPPFSKENISPGWLSPFSWTPSAINSWIGEELRTVGLEVRVEKQGKFSGSPHDFAVVASVFGVNDPAGSLLAWRGWSLHGRQTRLFERVPLATLPAISAGSTFEKQSQSVKPVLELDGRPGYYVLGEWDYLKKSNLSIGYYDNRGDPTEVSISKGQYAWDTNFFHLGWKLRLPHQFDLITQYMQGDTAMGQIVPPYNKAVIADFDAFFALLSKKSGRHRFTLRYDRFNVKNRDNTPHDTNNDDGHAWTVAYFGSLHQNLEFGVEWLYIRGSHAGRHYFNTPVVETETQIQIGLRWRL